MSQPAQVFKRTASASEMPSNVDAAGIVNATVEDNPDSSLKATQQPARPRAVRLHSTVGSGTGSSASSDMAATRRLSYPAQSFDDIAAASAATGGRWNTGSGGGRDTGASDDAIDRLFTSNSFDELVNSLHGLLAAHPTEQEISRECVIESLREASSYTSSEFLLADPAGLRLRQASGAACDSGAGRSSSLLRKLIDFPSTFVDQTLEVAARQGGYWIMSLLPIHEVVTLMLLLLSRWLNADFLQQLGWLALFYCGLACMLACSFRVLHALVTDRRRGKPLRRAVKRLLRDAPNAERTAAVRRLGSRRNQHGLTASSVGCLAACLCSALAYGLCSHLLVPASEMLLLSCLLALLLLIYGGGDKRYRWTKLAFLLASLYSGLPAMLSGSSGSPADRLPSWLAWTVAPAAALPLPQWTGLARQSAVRLSLSLPAAAKLASLACLASLLPCRSSVPCLLAGAWWHFGLLFAPEATVGGVLRLASGIGLAFAWLPLLCLYILAVVLAHTPAALFVYLWQACGLLLLLLLSVVMIYGVQNGLTIGRTNLKQDYPTLYRACLAAFFTACCLIPFVLYWLRVEPVATESTRTNLPSLTYEQFSQVCCQRGWSCHNNRVEAQAVCAHLEGVRVYWQGTVRGVAIGRTDNKMKDFVKFLPAFLHRLFACTYGRPYVCDNATVARFGPALCEALADQKACHLEDYNDHTYHIAISPKLRYANSSLNSQAQVVLLAPSSLRDQARLLTAGHRVRFSGVIEDTLSDPARVRLRSLDCSNCVWTLRPAKTAKSAKSSPAGASSAAAANSSGGKVDDDNDEDDDDDDDWSWARLFSRLASFCLQPVLII